MKNPFKKKKEYKNTIPVTFGESTQERVEIATSLEVYKTTGELPLFNCVLDKETVIYQGMTPTFQPNALTLGDYELYSEGDYFFALIGRDGKEMDYEGYERVYFVVRDGKPYIAL